MRMVPLRAAEPSLPEQMRAEHLGCPMVEVGCSVADVGLLCSLHQKICFGQPQQPEIMPLAMPLNFLTLTAPNALLLLCRP